uniref:Secreted protein n=1 Tax=Steinernema glaseri TaxID=37863 RepID=A0A1I7XWD5_9BILA
MQLHQFCRILLLTTKVHSLDPIELPFLCFTDHLLLRVGEVVLLGDENDVPVRFQMAQIVHKDAATAS